jgi:hypothetical protein
MSDSLLPCLYSTRATALREWQWGRLKGGRGGTEFVSWWAGNHLLGVYNLMALFPLGYTGSGTVSALSKARYLVGCRILTLL